MNIDYIIRDARKEEARQLAELINNAGKSENNQGLDLPGWIAEAGEGEDPFDYGAGIVAAESGYYSYHNIRIIEAAGKIAALSMSFVVEKRTDQEMEQMPEYYRVFKELTNSIPGSYYLDSLATLPEFRGNGFGRLMLEDTVNLAKDKGYDEIYLVVFEENKAATALYEKYDFHAQTSMASVDHPDMPYKGQVVLYRKEL